MFTERPSKYRDIFPTKNTHNLMFSISRNLKDFTLIMTNKIPDLHLQHNSQTFPLYTYQKIKSNVLNFDITENNKCKIIDGYKRVENITDLTLKNYQDKLGDLKITKADIFYYVYAVLHHKTYRQKYQYDLTKMLPTIPLLKDFWEFSKIGKRLAELHLNYEAVPAHNDIKEVWTTNIVPKGIVNKNTNFKSEDYTFYNVDKIKWSNKKGHNELIYNKNITLKNIPLKAEEYFINGKTAIGWIIDRYQNKVDKKSGLKNNPNDFLTQNNNPKYIINLIKSVANLSCQTIDLINSLPPFKLLDG
jgi:predicted helicase